MTDDNKLGGFDFAIQQMKAGKKVARIGWNGKGMWICHHTLVKKGVMAHHSHFFRYFF